MKDPKGGEPFGFRLGGPDTQDGIKWDAKAKRDDGSWDLEVVEATAKYVTPGGAVLHDKDRLSILGEGFWDPTATCGAWKRGYRVTRMMTPFPTGNFGNMARTFLEAKRKQDAGQFDEDGRPPLRVFVYERLAEKWFTEKRVPEQTDIDARVGEYKAGQRMSQAGAYQPFYIGKRSVILMTVDIQKACEWWVAREWIDGGDSGLLELGQSNGLHEIREIGARLRPVGVLVDNSYADRSRAIIEAASGGLLKGAILSYGRDNLKDKNGQPREYEVFLNRDPYEGTANQGRFHCHSVTFIPDRIKNILYVLTSGNDWHKWRVPRGLPSWYAQHMTAEQSIDGIWSKVRRDNHGWDCEVLQVLGSKLYGLWRDAQPMQIQGEPPSLPAPGAPVAAPAPAKVDPDVPQCPAGHGAMKWDGSRYWRCRCGAAKEGFRPRETEPEEDEDA